MSVPDEALRKRRDRAIAIILGVKEREVDQYLPQPVQAKLRKVILDQVNDLYEMCLDLAPQDGIVNELYLKKLAEQVADLHEHLVGS